MGDEQAHKAHAVRLHSDQASDFDERYQQFDAAPYRSTFTYGRKKIEELLERETREVRPGARVLDVGCGTGFNVRRLSARGFEVTGLEPAEGMRSRAIENNPGVEIVAGDIELLPFGTNSFDLVTAIEVIRYLRDPSRAVAELARVLRPGGMAFVTGAPLLSLNAYAAVNVVTSRVKVPTFTKVDHSFVTARSARRLFERAGFSTVAVRGRFVGAWHALGRLSPSLLEHALHAFEPIDDAICDLPVVRDLSNHLVVIAHK